MKTNNRKKIKPVRNKLLNINFNLFFSSYFIQQLYTHIASAIIPSAGIIAVPSAARHFPQQKVRGNDEWGPLASTLLRASSTGQLLIQSSTIIHSQQDDGYRRSIQKTSIGRMDANTDEEERYLHIFLIVFTFNLIYSDEEEQQKHRQTIQNSAMQNV